MKIHTRRIRPGSRWASAALVLLVAGALPGCSSNAPSVAVAEGGLTSAEDPTPEPTAAGAGQKDPAATETNFITLACETDADCRGEDRCIPWPGVDAGAPDAGGVVRGRCKVPGSP